MCVRFLMRFILVFLFVLSSLERGRAAAPGDLISMNHRGTISVSALEILNDEFYQSGALGYLIQDEHFQADTEVSFASAIAAQAALNTCAGSGGATLVRYDSATVPLLAYPGAEHLELWDNLLPKYADGTLHGLPW